LIISIKYEHQHQMMEHQQSASNIVDHQIFRLCKPELFEYLPIYIKYFSSNQQHQVFLNVSHQIEEA